MSDKSNESRVYFDWPPKFEIKKDGSGKFTIPFRVKGNKLASHEIFSIIMYQVSRDYQKSLLKSLKPDKTFYEQ